MSINDISSKKPDDIELDDAFRRAKAAIHSPPGAIVKEIESNPTVTNCCGCMKRRSGESVGCSQKLKMRR